MPKISVIVPIFNCERYIAKCAESLFSQSFEDVEFLFIDDCSTDCSVYVLKSLLEKQSKLRQSQVKLLRTPQNSGQAVVRKIGYSTASGEYILHCDSDDWFSPNAFEVLYNEAKVHEADIVIFDYYEVGTQSILKKGCFSIEKKDLLRNILETRVSCTVWNKLFKRSLFDNKIIEPVGNVGEDLLLVTQLVYFSNKIVYVEVPFYNYNILSSTSITAAKGQELSILKCQQVYDNISQLDLFWKEHNVLTFRDSIIHLKNKKRELIEPYTSDITIYKKWLNFGSGINYKILSCARISIKEKIKFLLILFRLWPLFCSIKNEKENIARW